MVHNKAIMGGCSFLLLVCALGASAADDIVIADFEEGQGVPRDWKHEGTGFSSPIRKGTHGRVKVIGFLGESLLSSLSWEGRDGETGRTLSPEFKIERKYIRFLVAGGDYPGRTCVNLLVDGKVVRSAAGHNAMNLVPVAFDVSSLSGKTAQIEIVDQEQRPWGHISVDQIVQTDTAHTSKIIRTGVSAFGGTVQTRKGRLEGDIQLHDGVLQVDGKPVPLETVHFVVMPARSPNKPQPHAVRMAGGEVWRTRIESFSDGKLSVTGGLPNKQIIDVASVAAIDFAPETKLRSPAKPGTLYRTQGRPIPGTLVWIKEKDIAIDCPLGILPLPRTGLVRYIFPSRNVNNQQGTLDEIGLRDGSVLRGKLELDKQNVVLEHPILTAVSLPWDDVRYLIRGSGEITWLADLERTRTDLLGPLAPPAAPRSVDLRQTNAGFLSSVQVKPHTVARYRLPTGRPRTFRTVIAPADGCCGDMTVSLEVSGKPIFKRKLFQTDLPQDLSLSLPDGDELQLRVDFGERLAFPCGVDFLDAHVMVPPADGR